MFMAVNCALKAAKTKDQALENGLKQTCFVFILLWVVYFYSIVLL